MKVAQILTAVHDGGLEKTVLQVCSGLSRRGIACTVHCLMDDNPGAEAFHAAGIPIRTYGAANRGLRGILSLPRTLLGLRRALRAEAPDVVVVHDFLPALAGRLAARTAGVRRTVAVLHSTYEWLGPRARLVDRALARGTTRFVAVSEAARNARLAWGGYPAERIEVLHNGIDPDRFRPDAIARVELRRELGVPDEAILVGSVGVVRASKRQIDLVEAMGPLMRERPDLHLLLVGSRRPHEQDYASRFDRAIAGLPTDRVHLQERRADIHRLLASLDIYAAPSESEGFGLSLVEAVLCGLPTVASGIGAHLEIADGLPSVRFHPPRDVEGLREGLRSFLRSPVEGIPEARSRVATRFSEEVMVDRWQDLLNRVVAP
jgi:glycosyltransferase involved in cell wall biosynthesis